MNVPLFPRANGFSALGRKIEHDPASRMFPIARKAIPLRSVTHRGYGPILDQGSVGACTGFAAAAAVNYQVNHPMRRRSRGNIRYLQNGDGLFLYARATVHDEWQGVYPPDDTGSSGIAVAKALREAGYITRYEWSFSIEDFMAGLLRGPLLVGTWWYDSMFYPEGPRGLVYPSGRKVGGHEYVAYQLDLRSEEVGFQNSWDYSWGIRGRFRMKLDEFETLLLDQGDAVLPVY